MGHMKTVLLMAMALMISLAMATASENTHEEGKLLTDISWMTNTDKKLLDTFITWYKLQLQTAGNVLNPKNWNLDVVMPSISGVISLYTGPILALILLLLVFGTLPTFVDGILNNPTFRRSASSHWVPTIDILAHAVHNAIEKY